MKIAVVYNRESEKVINLLGTRNLERYGKKSIARIVDALRGGGHQVGTFEGDKDLISNLEDFMPRVVKGERPGMVFNLSYGIQGQARYTHVPGILEMIGIPYVGSGPMAHSLSLDKVVTKMILLQHGLPTPEFAVLDGPDDPLPELPFPLIVKPRNESVSFGLRIVHDQDELREGAGVIFERFRQPVLVERYIDGREVNVGILGNSPPEALPPAELQFGEEGPKIYTLEDKRHKSGRNVEVVCPAPLDEATTARAQDLAVRAFRSLGCLDCCRVDMRMDAGGQLYILETNSLPSLGEHGSYVQAAAATGLDFPKLVNRLVEVASARYFGTPSPPTLDEIENDPARAVVAYVTSRRDALEKRIQRWSKRSSRTADPLGVRGILGEVDKALGELGLERVEDLSDEPEVVTWQTPAGLAGGTLLISHLDVPLAHGTVVPVFRREPEWLHGEGIGSSRAPLVMLEYALRALRAVRRTRKMRGLRLGVTLYTDEGLDCPDSPPKIRAAAERAGEVLVLRPGGTGDRVITQRRGLRRYALHVEAPPRRLGTASRKPELLRWLCSRLEECCALSSRRDKIAISVGELRTTAYRLLLPHDVKGSLLLSYLDAGAADTAEATIRSILKRGKDGYRFRLEQVSDRPPMLPRPANQRLLATLREVSARWDIPFEEDSSLLPSVAGLVPSDKPVVCGIGPAAVETMTAQEAVQRISVVQRTLMLALFLLHRSEVPA